MASGAGKRYAQAVFGLARESGRYDQWNEDLARLNELVSGSQASVFLGSPNIAENKKIELLDAILAKSQPEARNLAHLLLQRNRLNIIPENIIASVLAQQDELCLFSSRHRSEGLDLEFAEDIAR